MSTLQLHSMSFVYKNTTNSLFVINYIECMYNVLAKVSAVLGLLNQLELTSINHLVLLVINEETLSFC